MAHIKGEMASIEAHGVAVGCCGNCECLLATTTHCSFVLMPQRRCARGVSPKRSSRQQLGTRPCALPCSDGVRRLAVLPLVEELLTPLQKPESFFIVTLLPARIVVLNERVVDQTIGPLGQREAPFAVKCK